MKIVIVGKGGSGKTFMLEKLMKRGLKHEISHTTRPPRAGEKDGKDYHFVTPEDFINLNWGSFFQETAVFNGWHYATSTYAWNRGEVFIKTPAGVKQIAPEDRKKCLIIFLDIPEYILRERLAKRGDADSVNRRVEADRIDFANFTDFDIRITNPDF